MKWPVRALASAAALWLALAVPGFARAEELADTALGGTPVPEMQASYSVAEAKAESGLPAAGAAVPWLQHITDAARAYGVDAHLLQAVMQVESNFDPFAVSRRGAIGLMQIMPLTAMSAMGLRGTPQSVRQQLQDPAINVHAGALYLRSMMDTFAYRLDLALAAYNAGTGNVRKAGNRVPPNGETPQFVRKVTSLYASIKAAAQADVLAAGIETGPAITPQPVFITR